MDFLFDFGNALIFFLFGVFFVVFHVGIGFLIRPKNPNEGAKRTAYECGEPTVGDTWGRFNVRMWTIAIVFVVFDVEVVFMVPILMNFKQLISQSGIQPWLVFSEIMTFLAILVVGLWYVWVKGDMSYAWPKTDDTGQDDTPYVPYQPEEPVAVEAPVAHGGHH